MLTLSINFTIHFPPEVTFDDKLKTNMEIADAAMDSIERNLPNEVTKRFLAFIIPNELIIRNLDYKIFLKTADCNTKIVSHLSEIDDFNLIQISTKYYEANAQVIFRINNFALTNPDDVDELQKIIHDHSLIKYGNLFETLLSQFSYSYMGCSSKYDDFCPTEPPLFVCPSDIKTEVKHPYLAFISQSDGGNTIKLLERMPYTNAKALDSGNTQGDSILCAITSEVMHIPVRDYRRPTDPCIELSVYLKIIEDSRQNPFNRDPLTKEQLIIDSALMGAIANQIERLRPVAALYQQQEQNRETLVASEATSRRALFEPISFFQQTCLTYEVQHLNRSIRHFAFALAAKEFNQFLSTLDKKIANINEPDANPDTGFTALHVAIMRNRIDNAKVLLEHGARYDVEDKKGKTALDYIQEKKLTNLLDIIEQVKQPSYRCQR